MVSLEYFDKAKQCGFTGYSTMNKDQLHQLLRGKKVLKYKKNQICVETQTSDEECDDCALKTLFVRLEKQAAKQKIEKEKKRQIVIDKDMEVDVVTGEVLRSNVERSYIS